MSALSRGTCTMSIHFTIHCENLLLSFLPDLTDGATVLLYICHEMSHVLLLLSLLLLSVNL